MGFTVNGQEAPAWTAVRVRPGDVLGFQMASAGCRAYLAVAGGIDVPPVLGSRATYLRGRLGGLGGRRSRRATRCPWGRRHGRGTGGARFRRATAAIRPSECRVILGPQDDRFTPEGIRAFLEGPYDVTPQADRMGYRLKGPVIRTRAATTSCRTASRWAASRSRRAAAHRAPGRPPDDRRLHEDRHRDRRRHRRDRSDAAGAAGALPPVTLEEAHAALAAEARLAGAAIGG